MKTHRYQLIYKPYGRFVSRLRPGGRLALVSFKLLLVTTLILFQLQAFNWI